MNEINKQIPHSKKSLYQHKKRNFNEMINSNTINKEVKNEISSKKFKYNSNGIGCTSSTAEMNSPMNSKLNTNNVILYKHHRSTTRLSKALPLGRNNVKKISRSLTTKKFIGHPVSNNYTANNIKFSVNISNKIA